MHPELEKLIDMVVADGQVTEKERAVVIKKAIALEVDPDEAEIYLEGRLHQINEANKQIIFPAPPIEKKSNKEGDVKKCPACGAPTQSFATKCGDCGHEFRNIEATQGISKLYETIQKISIDDFTEDIGNSKEMLYEKKIASVISSFPIPNSKEEILEFLTMAYQEANKKVSWLERLDSDRGPVLMKRTWLSKCEQIILKARFSFKDDKKTLEEVEYYAKQLKIK